MSETTPPVSGLIGWFATNHVAANLLMIFIIGAGCWGLFTTKREMFPEVQIDQVSVRVPYLGAAPLEVEEGVVIRVEEAIKSIEGISQISSNAYEGMGEVLAEIDDGYELETILDEIKLAVDGISTFPRESERPIISKQSGNQWGGVMNVQLTGLRSEATMKEFAERIRDEITALDGVSYASVAGTRPFELSIEISEDSLRQYGLTLNQVAQVIRLWSIDIPGGTIRSDSGDIRLRAKGQAYTGQEFENILLLTRPDGTRIRLGDVATIRDGFAETESYAFFDGERSVAVMISASENENPIEISEAVNAYVDERNQTLPDGINLNIWGDQSEMLKERQESMAINMLIGACLVFILLGIFLHFKIAIWVIVGLITAVLGGFMLLEAVDVSINIMSLFAFIMVVGIVVDDAIIIAESAYTETEDKGYSVHSIVTGAQRVAIPATFGVLTTIAVFGAMLIQSGHTSAFSRNIAWVVVFALTFSLIESKLILPSHLASMKSAHGSSKKGVSEWVDVRLKSFIEHRYRPFLAFTIKNRWPTLAFFVSLVILTIGLMGGGYVRMNWFPDMQMDYVMAQVELQDGAPEQLIVGIVEEMEGSLNEVEREIQMEYGIQRRIIEHSFAFVQGGKSARFNVELKPEDERPVSGKELENRWREKLGDIAGTKKLSFSSGQHSGGGPPIALKLQGYNYRSLEQAADELASYLQTFNGVYEVESSNNAGPEELKLRIRPEAESLGITLTDLASQVRQAFYGAEAQRIQRGESEVRVMVRYPEVNRKSVGNLENMWIRLPDGREVPFDAVADYQLSTGYSSVQRLDGRRTVSVAANLNPDIVQVGEVIGAVRAQFMPDLLDRYPDVKYDVTGASQRLDDSQSQMLRSMLLAVILLYALIAIPLKSYVQPLIIMFIIPFGMIGAVIGHMIVGIPITSLSSLGLIALAGVVVNDAILMVDHVNKRTEAGYSASDAAVEAGAVRFRPILLTSLTTFFGLTPVLLETSMAAQMVVPMAVSLSFGILFSTVITLIFLPCLFNILGERGTTFGKFIAFWTNRPLPTALPDPANQPVGQQP